MAAAAAAAARRLPKIDFSDVAPANGGSLGWAAAREQVMQALTSYGCFEAVYDPVTPSLRDSMSRFTSEELFPLPIETKLKNASDKPFGGYLGQIPGLAFESLGITDAHLAHGVPAFAVAMWPDGNPSFCETAYSYSKKLAELEQMVRRMVLESLGVTKYLQEQLENTWYLLRLSKYGEEKGEDEEGETKKAEYVPHRDTNTLGIICQLNGVDGLEVETGDGEWIISKPSTPTSLFVVAGDSLRAWSNGRIVAPLHRVRLDGKDAIRYSAILFSCPMEEQVVEAPPELVDDEHPSLFKPYSYGSFLQFAVSEEGAKDTDGLHKEIEAAIYKNEPLRGILTVQLKADDWEIDRKVLKMGEKIGSGSCVDMNAQHDNIVPSIGACTKSPQYCIVTGCQSDRFCRRHLP
ncbi:putative 2-oxoglutarate-dependent dioxygenase AOP1 [Canna indica]|uniref:2-oxoglutarate-dependent dioxygenase DAO n=1 Tax=Canna indica TaxID=4628 RepID=A0AAQ3JYY9_9LILI|nr:putative 2-oxoglutarate-dependent dioxygenase AOP1 [Canna indica]